MDPKSTGGWIGIGTFIFGTVFAAVTQALVARWLPPKAGGQVAGGRSARSRVALGFFAGVATIGLVLGLYLLLSPSPPDPTIRIESPRLGDSVGRSVEVLGTSSHVPSDHRIWLLVNSVERQGLHLQGIPAARQEGGRWSARAYFSYGPSRATASEEFEISALLTTPEATGAIEDYFAKREGGFERASAFLPAGAEIKSKIRVVARPGKPRVGCVHPRISTVSSRGSARIETIRGGDLVPSSVDPLRGAYRDIPRDSRVWILVYSTVVGRFYPQSHASDQPAALRDGRFRSSAFFGGQPGERYEVVAVLATPSASRSLSRVLRAWEFSKDFRGLTASKLPRGLDEKDCVEVILQS